MDFQSIISLFKEAAIEFRDDGAGDMAASVAYYALFSLFPLLLALVSASSFFLDPSSAESYIFGLVGPVLPQSEQWVSDIVQEVIAQRGAISPLALASLLWSGTQLFASVSTVVNKAWDVKESRGFVQNIVIRFVLFVGIGLLFSLSFGMTLLVNIVSALQVPVFGSLLFANPVWSILIELLPPVFSFLMFLFVYKVVPNRRVEWSSAVVGAIVSTILFELSKILFVFYVERLASYSLVYGPISGVIVLLFWVYVSASILLFGAEVAKSYAELLNRKTPVPPKGNQ